MVKFREETMGGGLMASWGFGTFSEQVKLVFSVS